MPTVDPPDNLFGDLGSLDHWPSPSPLFDQALEVATREWVATYGNDECSNAAEMFRRLAWNAWFDIAMAERYGLDAGYGVPEPPRSGCHLYRLWGGTEYDRRLVYIGVSRSLATRLKAHRRRWDETVWWKATWEPYDTVAEMFAAEREAIEAEMPPLNIACVR